MGKYLTSTSGGVLTPDQAAALQGTDGTPNAGNKYLTSEAIIVTAENKDSVTILKGQPLKVHASGIGVQLAGNLDACIAFAGTDTVVGEAVPLRVAGLINRSDWTPITGSSALAALGVYFLNGTPGRLTTAFPQASAGAMDRAAISNGKFHGTIWALTPNGTICV